MEGKSYILVSNEQGLRKSDLGSCGRQCQTLRAKKCFSYWERKQFRFQGCSQMMAMSGRSLHRPDGIKSFPKPVERSGKFQLFFSNLWLHSLIYWFSQVNYITAITQSAFMNFSWRRSATLLGDEWKWEECCVTAEHSPSTAAGESWIMQRFSFHNKIFYVHVFFTQIN